MDKKAICFWKYYPVKFLVDDDYYETGCDELFVLLEGSLEENNFNYCPYCGCLIEETT